MNRFENEAWNNTLKYFITVLLKKYTRGMTNTEIVAENQNELDAMSDDELVDLDGRLQSTSLKDLVHVYQQVNM